MDVISVVIIATLFAPNTAYAHLIALPKDREVLVGKSTHFNCSTSITDKEIHWYFYPLGATDFQKVNIYAHGKLLNAEKFRINNSSKGVLHLEILTTSLEDAGRYKCQDDEGFGNSSSAQLIVLASNPVCQSSIQLNEVVGPNHCGVDPDEIRLSCSVTYRGNIPPVMEWKSSRDKEPISNHVTSEIGGGNVTYVLRRTVDISMSGYFYICDTTRSSSTQYTCTSDLITVMYAFNNYSLSQMDHSDTARCLANSSQPCSYKWMRYDAGHESVVSTSFSVILRWEGLYICEAECTVRMKQCLVVSRQVQVLPETTNTCKTNENCYANFWKNFWIVTIFILAVLLVAAIIAICRGKVRRRKKRTEKRASVKQKIDKEKSEICRMAILKDAVYISRVYFSDIEVYDMSFKFLKYFKIPNVRFIADFVTSSRGDRLFVLDYKHFGRECELITVKDCGKIINKWPTGSNTGPLSATYDYNVILITNGGKKLIEYSETGDVIRKMKLTGESLRNPWHCIKVSERQYAVCYGKFESTHGHRVRVFEVNAKYKDIEPGVVNIIEEDDVRKSIGNEKGYGPDKMNRPVHLAIDKENELIYVSDHHNGRVLVMSLGLTNVTELIAQEQGVFKPRRLCFYNGTLVVSDEYRVAIYNFESTKKDWYDVYPTVPDEAPEQAEKQSFLGP